MSKKQIVRRSVGRPSKLTDTVASRICLEIANGKSLRKILESADMPSMATVMRWLLNNSEFREQYARARELQADICADNITDIANEPPERIQTKEGDRIDPGSVQDKKLRMDAEKWRASKLAPKKYGDKAVIEKDESVSPIDQNWRVTIVHTDKATYEKAKAEGRVIEHES